MSRIYQAVEIFISCRKLKNNDVLSKSDPQVIVNQKRNEQWVEIGRTETIQNNLNPNFKCSISIKYLFEEKQELQFQVVDVDSDGTTDNLGECYTTLGTIVGAKNNTLVQDLVDNKHKNKAHKSQIVLIADKISKVVEQAEENQLDEQIDPKDLSSKYEYNTYFHCEWKGVKLMNTDGWFGKSDPFLRFYKMKDQNQMFAHETEVVMDNLNPLWRPQEINIQKLNNGDKKNPIKVECWDWQKKEKHQLIGEFTFTVEELNNGKREFDLINPNKKKSAGQIVLCNFNMTSREEINQQFESERLERIQRKGQLKNDRIQREQMLEQQRIEMQRKLEIQQLFLEYIRGNTQLNLVVAVDYTVSNGDPESSDSLHHCKPSGLNSYQEAIQSIGEILLDYDFDKKVSCYGFGGQLNYPSYPSRNTEHCFPLTGDANNSEVLGVEGIQKIYKYSLQHVSLNGPTLFSPILQQIIKVAKTCKEQGSQVYTILLILTDGEINDMQQSINNFAEASKLPVSVVIVGVGNADFSQMEKLDGDQNGQQKASRDIVQFVPFRKFNGNGAALCKEVLSEIPEQLVSYMKEQGINPQVAPQIDQQKICM